MNLWANRPLAPAEVETAVAPRVRALMSCPNSHGLHNSIPRCSSTEHVQDVSSRTRNVQMLTLVLPSLTYPPQVPPGSQHTWFENTPTLQSVPAIWHAHVLWRQPTAADSSAALGNTAAVDGT